MDKRTTQSVNNFLTAVAQRFDLTAAYLFGSYAKGKQGEDSDIDLALVIESLDQDRKFDVQIQLMLLASRFDTRIEPHPLSGHDFESGNSFAIEIRKTGIELLPLASERSK